nr:MAG TPA: hypothetical protein [Caudoviricetes sp.]
MKTYRLQIKTVEGTEIFLISAANLDAAIREAKKDLTARVISVIGQVTQ